MTAHHVRGELRVAAAAAVVAGCLPAPRLRGALLRSSATSRVRCAAAQRPSERAASSAPRATTRSWLLSSTCDAPCAQRACARGRGASLLLRALAILLLRFVSQASAGAPAGKLPSVWVKLVDMPNTTHSLLNNVDMQETVDELVARLAKTKLDVDPALVTLRLVPCGVSIHSAAEELCAKILAEPRLTLEAAGIFVGCSLLVDTESIQAVRELAVREKKRAKELAEEEDALQRAKQRVKRGAAHVTRS